MTNRSTGPFRADQVGSLLRPPELLSARERFKQGALSAAGLRAVEDGSIREVARRQEAIGLRSITDGEFRRSFWHTDFFSQIEGVVIREGTYVASFQREDGKVNFTPQTIAIASKLRHRKPIQVDDFKFLKSVTRQTPKVSIPSPVWLHYRSNRDSVDAAAYPDLHEFVDDLVEVYASEMAALASAGCTYLQLDETTFAFLCDPKLRESDRKVGRNPDELVHDYVKLLNRVIDAAPDGMAICMHSCRGNYRSSWVASGGYEPVAEILFSELSVDGFFLEYDDARSGDFAPLRFVPKGKKQVVLGLVSSKRSKLESKDEIKRRLEEAVKYMPL